MPTKQQKAAREIAEIMYASLQQFPEEEQQKRIKAVEKIAAQIRVKSPRVKPATRLKASVRRQPTGISSKPSPTPATRPSRRRSAATR